MKETTTPLLRPTQVRELEDDLSTMQAQKGDKNIRDKASLFKQIKQTNQMLDAGRPHPLTGEEKDLLHAREKELANSIQEGMLTRYEMKKGKNGMSAAHAHLRWEQAKKKDILEWKNIRTQLNEDGDPDFANTEHLRAEGHPFGYDANALMPGVHMMSELAKQNWPLGEPKVETAIKQTTKKE